MGPFIVLLIVVVCILLALVILVQNPKGGGLATGFQGASQVGGVQKTADFLEKSTWYLVVALFVLCLFSSTIYKTNVVTSDGGVPTENVAPEADSGDGAEVSDEVPTN